MKIISGKDKKGSRKELRRLAVWSLVEGLMDNSTEEMVQDRRRANISRLQIDNVYLKYITSRFLAAVVHKDATVTPPFESLGKCHLKVNLMQTPTVESVLTYSATMWLTAARPLCRRITGCPLPLLEQDANTRGLKRARRIFADPSHPGNCVFNPLAEDTEALRAT